MKGDKMFELYAKFIGKNEKKIIDDFCKKIKRELIGDLTLDEYSRFRFWKNHSNKYLRTFYKVFKEDTKGEMPYDIFCELMWNTLDDALPEDLQEILDSVKSIQMGEA